jgi:hypothetical protein
MSQSEIGVKSASFGVSRSAYFEVDRADKKNPIRRDDFWIIRMLLGQRSFDAPDIDARSRTRQLARSGDPLTIET